MQGFYQVQSVILRESVDEVNLRRYIVLEKETATDQEKYMRSRIL